MPFFFGNSSNNQITASESHDLILGFGGDDFIFARGGNDLVITGRGNDTVHAGDGDDLVLGGRGNDTLFGDAGNDRLIGGSGDDDLSGGSGNDFLIGGRGFDRSLYDGSIFDYDFSLGRGPMRVNQLDATGTVIATDTLIGVEALHYAAEDYTFYTDGRDNAVLFTGDDTGVVTENDGTPATGRLVATDFDGDDGIVPFSTPDAPVPDFPPAPFPFHYGSFAIDADGFWTYTLHQSNPIVDALNDGDTLTDTFDVLAEDGTVQTVTITIHGADDVPPPDNVTIDFDGPDNFRNQDFEFFDGDMWVSDTSGFYAQNGFTADFLAVHRDTERVLVGNPFHDADSTGDSEFGVNDGTTAEDFADLTITQDNGDDFVFSGMNVGGGEDGGAGTINLGARQESETGSDFVIYGFGWDTLDALWDGTVRRFEDGALVAQDAFADVTTEEMLVAFGSVAEISVSIQGDAWIDNLIFV